MKTLLKIMFYIGFIFLMLKVTSDDYDTLVMEGKIQEEAEIPVIVVKEK